MRNTCGLLMVVMMGLSGAGCQSLAFWKKKPDMYEILAPRPNVPAPYAEPAATVSAAPIQATVVPPPARVEVAKPTPVAKIRTTPKPKPPPVVMPIPVQRVKPKPPPAIAIVEPPPRITKPAPLPTKKSPKRLTYKVKKGDSLWKIGRMYGVSSDELAAANNMKKSAVLKIGKVLTLPAGAHFIPPSKRPKIKPRKNKVVKKKTPAKPIVREPIPKSGIYHVAKGDSLWTIGRRFGVSVKKLQSLNNLKSTVLQIGQTLVLVDNNSGTSATTTTTTTTMKAPQTAAVKKVNVASPAIQTAVDKPKNGAKPPPAVKAVATINVDKLKQLPHFVEKSDTLESIAEMYGSKPAWILKANPNIKNNDELQRSAGVEIKVPCPDIE